MRGFAMLVSMTLVIALTSVAFAQDKKPAGDAAGIRAALTGYGEAYNKGDVTALMAFWSDDPEFVDDSGKSTRGRDALTALFRTAFEQSKGTTIKISEKSLRFLTPDVAVLDGLVKMTTADGVSEAGAFSAIMTRTGGKWLMSRIQDLALDTSDSANGNYDRLKQLDWMVGEWESEGKNTPVTISCKWGRNRCFLHLEQTIHLKDRDAVTITQIIGWDPLQQQIRCWVFDSNGGFGEGLWTRTANRWSVESAGVLMDGRRASSVSTWKYVNDSTCEWESAAREVDGRPSPDIVVKYVKKVAAK